MSEEKFFGFLYQIWKASNGDPRETLDRIHVKYVLPKGAFMSKTVVTCVQKVSLIGLKLLTIGTNVTTVLCVQRKKLNLV